jgi:hypothetical protein
MNRYLLNSPVLTAHGRWRYDALDIKAARAFVAAAPFESAVGHAATACHLAAVLGVAVPCARVAVQMQPGDRALVFCIGQRLGEGQVLDDGALAALPPSFGLLERLA